MKRKHITESNRAAWNQAVPIHRKGREVDLRQSFSDPAFCYLDRLEQEMLERIGIRDMRVAHLCCNNGRELLSLLNLGARSGVGFDISDEAISEAQELALIAGTDCTFVRADVYEIDSDFYGQFDRVYITVGALSWLPDLSEFFNIVSNLLADRGILFIREQHPVMYMLAQEDEPGYDPDHPLNMVNSYFRTDPWVEPGGIDYVGRTKYESKPSYSFTQKMSDIINAVINSGIRLREFHEYPTDISSLFPSIEKSGIAPLSYILIGQKE